MGLGIEFSEYLKGVEIALIRLWKGLWFQKSELLYDILTNQDMYKWNSELRAGKYLSSSFPIENSLK